MQLGKWDFGLVYPVGHDEWAVRHRLTLAYGSIYEW